MISNNQTNNMLQVAADDEEPLPAGLANLDGVLFYYITKKGEPNVSASHSSWSYYSFSSVRSTAKQS